MKLIKILGSLPAALVLIVALVVLLSVSTIMESLYGTPFAQKIFYTANWFDLVLTLVWVNILCATLTRVPFKKHHTGFVITHIGILMFLAGALLSRLHGVEGQMTLFENESKNKIVTSGYVLDIRGENKHMLFHLNEKKNLFPRRWEMGGAAVTALRAMPHAREAKVLVENGRSAPANPAVQAVVKSEMLGIEETVVLIADNPADPASAAAQIGPAHFLLKKKTSSETPVLRLVFKNGDSFSIPVTAPEMEGVPLGKSGLAIRRLKYFSNAKIRDDHLVDDPEGTPFNPAVEFEIADAEGSEEHTRFLLFPGFSSLKGGAAADRFGLTTTLDVPREDSAGAAESQGPAFVFLADPEGRWSYKVHSSKGVTNEIPLEVGKSVSTGWMDITVTPKLFFNRAKIVSEVRAEDTGSWAVELLIEKNGQEDRRWIFADRAFEAGGIKVSLDARTAPVPFELTLKDFRRIDYPGTSKPAAFESDVVLTDATEKVRLETKIFMNHPLDYAGYRVFQSSYIQDPAFGEASVFTVAKNPGIGLIYGGAAIILAGVLVLFYLHPFFNPSVRIR
jgi:hypothetical protein